jgi:hypothetical protein
MAVPALVRLKLSTLERVLEPRRFLPSPDEHTVRRTIELVEKVLRLGRRLFRPGGCLTRGLTLHYFLRRAGVDVRLCFGMGHPDGKEMAGHCWLELDGRPFLERRDPRLVFGETYRIPSALARV